MSRTEDIFSNYPETLVIGTGVTCTITALPGQVSLIMKYGSGGTLWLYGASSSIGCTFATAQEYLFNASEIYNGIISGDFRIGATGATTTVYITRGRSQGFGQT